MSQRSLLASFTLPLTGQLKHTKEKQAATKPNKIQATKQKLTESCLGGYVCVCVTKGQREHK